LAKLPHFNPDDGVAPLPPPVVALREQIHAADAILFSTPEYAGALPGSFKNLLDWTIGDDQQGSIYEKRVGWINTSPRGAAHALAELRAVLGFAHATIVDAVRADVPLATGAIAADGLVSDPDARAVARRSARAVRDLTAVTPNAQEEK
jgi:chromate reductase